MLIICSMLPTGLGEYSTDEEFVLDGSGKAGVECGNTAEHAPDGRGGIEKGLVELAKERILEKGDW